MSFMQELKKDNLCTYFVLPLLRLNKFSFISSNFIDSYITRDGVCIVVQIYDSALVSRDVYLHPGYMATALKGEYFYMIFTIPQTRRADVHKFLIGQYSRMSKSSKELIYTFSTLDYKVQSKTEAKQTTDGRLLALTRHDALRRMYENELKVVLSPDDELLEQPNERSFISLDELTVIEKGQLE